MNKRLMMTIAYIVSCVISFVYFFIAALFYSMGNSLFWLFVVLFLVSLVTGLMVVSLLEKIRTKEFRDKDKLVYLIVTIVSVISFPAVIFNVLGYLSPIKEEEAKEKPLKEKKEKKWFQKISFILCAAGLLGIFLFSIFARIVDTNGGKVQVIEQRLTSAMTKEFNAGEENKVLGNNFVLEDETVSYAFTEYKPKDASMTNPMPVVFVLPGFTRTKATMYQYAIELSRRGFVVFVIDPGCQGASTYTGYKYNDDGTRGEQNGYNDNCDGLEPLVQYVYNNVDRYNYVDRDRFGATGHSAGGGDVSKLAVDYAGATYADSVIKSVYISGYIKTSATNRFKNFRCNAGISYAYYDEGEYRYQDATASYLYCATEFVHDINGNDTVKVEMEEDKEFGDIADGSYRIIHREFTNHCFQMYDSISIANSLDFFVKTLGVNTTIANDDQVWQAKEAWTGLSLVSAFTFIFALFYLLIDLLPFMKSLDKAAQERLEAENLIKLSYKIVEEKDGIKPRKRTIASMLCTWIPMVITGIVACLDFIPLARLTMSWLPDAAGNTYTYLFPERMMNAVFFWAVANGTLGIILFFGVTSCENLVYKLSGHPENISWEKFKGLKVKPLDLLKSLVLAIVLFFVFYGVLQLVYMLMHEDFRFMLISASPLNKRMFITWLIYIPGFYVFYFSNSLRVNLSLAREGWSEAKTMIVAALANSLGLVFILIINYWVYFRTGTVKFSYWSQTDKSEMWLFVNMVFGLIPMMALLPIVNRLTYKKCGNIYAGAFLSCMIFIMMSLSGSISLIPM